MTYFRILLLHSFFFIFSPFSLLAEKSFNIPEYSRQWAQECAQHMTEKELHITANILYLLHANALIDLQLQKFFAPLDHLTQKVRRTLATHENSSEDIALLKKHVDKLSLVKGTAVIYTHTLTNGLEYYNAHQTEMVNAALSALQLCGQQILMSWADENAARTTAILENSAKNFAESAQYFTSASALYHNLSEEKLPVETEEHNKNLTILDVLLKTNPQITTTADAIINMLNHTSDHAMEMLAVSAELYKETYAALYEVITTPEFNKNYATTLFCMHGLLPEEYQTVLPHPKNVFQHMLQTTKLYTQTEVLS